MPNDLVRIAVWELGVDGVRVMMPLTSGVSVGIPSVSRISVGRRRPSPRAVWTSAAGKNLRVPRAHPVE